MPDSVFDIDYSSVNVVPEDNASWRIEVRTLVAIDATALYNPTPKSVPSGNWPFWKFLVYRGGI